MSYTYLCDGMPTVIGTPVSRCPCVVINLTTRRVGVALYLSRTNSLPTIGARVRYGNDPKEHWVALENLRMLPKPGTTAQRRAA